MKYTLLTLRQELSKDKTKSTFHFSEYHDKLDRVRTKTIILGSHGEVRVWSPRGQEKKWKRKMIEHVEERMNQSIKYSQQTLADLQRFKDGKKHAKSK